MDYEKLAAYISVFKTSKKIIFGVWKSLIDGIEKSFFQVVCIVILYSTFFVSISHSASIVTDFM